MSAPTAPPTAQALAAALRRPRFEVLPLDGIEEQVLEHLDTDVKVTVTASPRKGLEATLEPQRAARRAPGIPSSRTSPRGSCATAPHLEEAVARLSAAGVRELFVPAGDAHEPGEFPGAADLLRAMGTLRAAFDEIGITGYPESHHLISDEETIQAMFAKAPMATCIISQICFDPDVITGWVREVRRRGTHLPIWIGLPGSVDYAKLVRISMKIGLGESAPLPAPPPQLDVAPDDAPVQARPAAARARAARRRPRRRHRRLPPLHVQRGGAHRALAQGGHPAARVRLKLRHRVEQPGREVGRRTTARTSSR